MICEHFDVGVGNMNINITVSCVNTYTKLKSTRLTLLTLLGNFRKKKDFQENICMLEIRIEISHRPTCVLGGMVEKVEESV